MCSAVAVGSNTASVRHHFNTTELLPSVIFSRFVQTCPHLSMVNDAIYQLQIFFRATNVWKEIMYLARHSSVIANVAEITPVK